MLSNTQIYVVAQRQPKDVIVREHPNILQAVINAIFRSWRRGGQETQWKVSGDRVVDPQTEIERGGKYKQQRTYS